MRPRHAFVLSTLLLAGTVPLEAQTGLPPQPFEAARSNGAFTATLVSADATHLVAQADDGSVVTFVVDGTSSVPPGLVPGSRVTVRYELEGSRYRVASVGIPKIPLEGGATTVPPPSPDAVEPAADGDGEASLESPASDTAGEVGDAAPTSSGSPAGVVEGAAAQPIRSPPASAPPLGANIAGALHAPPATDGTTELLQPGREAFLIGAGLVLVACALGLLAFLRR